MEADLRLYLRLSSLERFEAPVVVLLLYGSCPGAEVCMGSCSVLPAMGLGIQKQLRLKVGGPVVSDHCYPL